MHCDFLGEITDGKQVGGISLLSGYINQVRQTEKNVAYAIAGDMFRGSVIDSEYKGISTVEIMNLLAPDVFTIGNHEADYGLGHLLLIEKCAKFPIINANMYIRSTGTRLFRPYMIMEKDGMRILFIGAVTEDVLSQTKTEDLVGSLVDVDDAATEIEKICSMTKGMNIDLTVLLTHIGVEQDKKLAKKLSPDCGVNIIIGGHSHTFMEEPIIENGIIIVQAGTGTGRIGRFDIEIDIKKNVIESYKWECVPIDDSHCPQDDDLRYLIYNYKTQTDKKFSRIITRFDRVLTHPSKYQETELGNLFADIIRKGVGTDISLVASGSIRKKELGPIVTYERLIAVYTFDDKIYGIKVTGRVLKRMFDFCLGAGSAEDRIEFYQVSSGLKMVYDRKDLYLISMTFKGKEIEDDRIYSVSLQDYHYLNMDKFFGITEADLVAPATIISGSAIGLIDEEMSSHGFTDSRVEGRITFVN
jgi:5'-nucleotidase